MLFSFRNVLQRDYTIPCKLLQLILLIDRAYHNNII